MGRPFRTPSPAREPYISSSNVNSPSSPSQYLKQMETPPRHLDVSGGDSCRQQNAPNQATEKPKTFFLKDAEEMNDVETPKTPTRAYISLPWHGLPSPQTPGFPKYEQIQTAVEALNQSPPKPFDAFSDANTSNSKVKNGHGSKSLENNVERDAALASQLDKRASPMSMRRSARLRKKQREDGIAQPSLTAPRPTPKPSLDGEYIAQPGHTVVPCRFGPVPFEGIPPVHSASWQLQYPSGGSTHPSYPYPALDPRLIFHQVFVPLFNGLPDVSRVPKLALPMNWKHVSWAGLVPIVFDPYHQAFKLTPIGPLPLTCEELHQSGLHKYVPGGELHPEYGLLPDMLKLSDGSDAEIFNFDNIDWTLPWEGQLDFHAPSAKATKSKNKSADMTGSLTPSTFDLEAIYPWREARDCPDMIIDLADGWRWLSTKETNPTADFIPTPGKTRHGTGAVRLARKFKLPIPELMMLALQAEEDAVVFSPSAPNPILPNQDQPTRGKTLKLFCPFKSVATPANADITLLGGMEFTIVELLSYFPQHYYWGKASERLLRAGVSPSSIRNMICMTRALDDEMAPKLNTIKGAVSAARKRDATTHEATEEVDIIDASMDTPEPEPTALAKSDVIDDAANYTAEGWTYDVEEKMDYPLLALAHGLQSLPSGVDAGPLTALILWCRENGHYRVLLSEVLAMLKEAGIEPLIEPGGDDCPDKEVMARYAEALKNDHRRIRKSNKAGKRAMKDFEESLSKRTKAE